MDSKRFHSLSICLAAAVFLISSGLFAQDIQWGNTSTGSNILSTALNAYDNEYNIAPNVTTIDPGVFITLEIDNYAAPYNYYEFQINLTITPTLNGVPAASYPIVLTVVNNHYGNFGSFIDLQQHRVHEPYNGAVVEVNSIAYTDLDNNTSSSTFIPENVTLSAYYKAKRYYPLSPTVPSISATTASNSLQFFWNDITGAQEYQLEWTWVDRYGASENTILNAGEIPFSIADFKNNCTRVQTSETNYSIPLLFRKGFILYRVRAVGRFVGPGEDGSVLKFGPWSSEPTASNASVANWSSYAVSSHQDLKNWQLETSYAEEGKRKEVISYYDGTLRNRQTVTKINTDNSAIVGEVIYDEEGRPAVEVLPVPAGAPDIDYYHDFNLNYLNQPYSYQDFLAEENSCNITTLSMSIERAAARYYSSHNSIMNNYQDFVPDADGYPFSQIEYLHDNTGRIARKGGVGPTYALGGGHEMKYYYDVPSQEELNRLFGYNVGHASHYKKNTVVDPNGQVSVSYVDPKGKTIATALSGVSPDNMVPLEGADSGSITTDLLNKLTGDATDTAIDNNFPFASGNYGNIEDGLRYDAQKSFTQVGQAYSLMYRLQKETPFTINCGSGPRKYPLVYRLTERVTGNCGETIVAIDTRIGNVSLQPVEEGLTYNDVQLMSGLLGDYSISKTLTVDKDALELFVADYIKNGVPDCIAAQPEPEVDMSGCYTDCDSCVEHLMNYHYTLPNGSDSGLVGAAAFVAEMQASDFEFLNMASQSQEALDNTAYYTQQFAVQLQECRRPCDEGAGFVFGAAPGYPLSSVSCDNSLQALVNDMLPGGQYGVYHSDIDDEGNILDNPVPDISQMPMSIYNINNTIYANNEGIDSQKVDWRHPYFFGDLGSAPVSAYSHYLTADGQIDYITVFWDAAAEAFVPPLVMQEDESVDLNMSNYAANGVIVLDATGNLYKAEPQLLKNVTDFISLIESRDSWGLSLVKYHPEFDYLDYQLKNCEALRTFQYNLGPNNASAQITANSDGFDTMIQSVETFADAEAAGFFNDPLSLFSNDPFFNELHPLDGSVFALGITTPNVSLQQDFLKVKRSVMLQALSCSGDTNDPYTNNNTQGYERMGVSMFMAIYKTIRCTGLDLSCDLPDTTTYSSLMASVSVLTPEEKNMFWKYYASYYVGLKNKLQHVFINLHAARQGFYNDCIGNDNEEKLNRIVDVIKKYTQEKNAVKGWYNNAIPQNTLFSQNGSLLGDKEKRFIPFSVTYNSEADDSTVAADLLSAGNAEYYSSTGICPNTRDLQIFLRGLMLSPEGTPNLSMASLFSSSATITHPPINYLTPALFQALECAYSATVPSTNAFDLVSAHPSGTRLEISIDQSLPAQPLPITLELPSGFAFSWSNYGSAWTVVDVLQLTYTSTESLGTPGAYLFHFAVLLKIHVTSQPAGSYDEVVVSGSTVANLTCTNNPADIAGGLPGPDPVVVDLPELKCDKKHRFSKALEKLLIHLQPLMAISTNPITLDLMSASDYQFIGEYFGIDNDDVVEWHWTPGTTFHLITVNNYDLVHVYLDLSLPLYSLTIGAISSHTSFVHAVNGVFVDAYGEYVYNSGRIFNHQGRSMLYFSCCSSCGEWDYDADGIGDSGHFGPAECDICDNRIDSNNDGIIDCNQAYVCDSMLDTDCDGFLNTVDHCPTIYSTTNIDSDGDGIGDICEPVCGNLNELTEFTTKLKDAVNAIILYNGPNYNSASIPAVNVLVNDCDLTSRFQGMYNDFSSTPDTVALGNFIVSKNNNFPYNLFWQDGLNGSSYTISLHALADQLAGPVADVTGIVFSTSGGANELTMTGHYQGGGTFSITGPVWFYIWNPSGSSSLCAFLDYSDNTQGGVFRRAALRENPNAAPQVCDCVPQTVIPQSSTTDRYLTYTNLMTSLGSSLLSFNEFRDYGLVYILDAYSDYLSAFGINSSAETSHPQFLTILQFGTTPLHYGFNYVSPDYPNPIDEFHNYIASYAENAPPKTWSQYVDFFLASHSGICPPVALPVSVPGTTVENACEIFNTDVTATYTIDAYNQYIENLKNEFRRDYIKEAMTQAVENFDLTYPDLEYQYTLYYYDQADNLIQTVPPQGVQRLAGYDQEINNMIDAHRNLHEEDISLLPTHDMKTLYRYNSLNQLVWQKTPDGGVTRFAYDKLGRIIASQNANQIATVPVPAADPNIISATSDLSIYENTIRKTTLNTSWSSAYVADTPIISSGYVQHTIKIDEVNALSKSEMIVFGLAYQDDTDPYKVSYAFEYQAGGVAKIHLGATVLATPSVSIQDGDIMKIVRSSGQIKFYRNNTLVYTATDANPFNDMHLDSAVLKFKSTIFYPVILSNLTTPTLSYTRYDGLGRTEEAGQLHINEGEVLIINDNGQLLDLSTNQDVDATGIPFNISAVQEEVTKTIYDDYAPLDPNSYLSAQCGRFTRNRVAAILTYATKDAATTVEDDYETAIVYSYDIHGNVDEMVQAISRTLIDVGNVIKKRVNYEYDLISGNVNKVVFQKGSPDQFIHRYQYDADNRITAVETSREGYIWEKDAEYQYYAHGPLARTILGDKKVQGTDYAYTLQGWLKAVNSENMVNAANDMGADGNFVSKDAYGFSLSYYGDDYQPRVADITRVLGITVTDHPTAENLFNGNIRGMISTSRSFEEKVFPSTINTYRYDQLNRIFKMRSYSGSYATGSGIIDATYDSSYSYDRNGNLTTLQATAPRLENGVESYPEMDNFEYHYEGHNNKLVHLKENQQDGGRFDLDIDVVEDVAHNVINNYRYDEIGQMVYDQAEDRWVLWRVDGKVKAIASRNGSRIQFFYDGLGNRVVKKVNGEGDSGTVSTQYALDAQGNVLGVYKQQSEPRDSYALVEHHIYGSSRLGLQQYSTASAREEERSAPGNLCRLVGDKRYELTNHLGNIMSVINDRKIVSDGMKLLEAYFFGKDTQSWYPIGKDTSLDINNDAQLEARVGGGTIGGMQHYLPTDGGICILQFYVYRDGIPSSVPLILKVTDQVNNILLYEEIIFQDKLVNIAITPAVGAKPVVTLEVSALDN
ncbi:MAG TPA: hypothetical protein VGB50_11725, partial [Flavobacterium sp.]